jgi:cytidylate kinase
MIIAIDGPSGSGKGTLSRKLAQHYNLEFLDTGILYRAVAEKALQKGLSPDHRTQIIQIAKDLDLSTVPHEKLRGDGVARIASQIAIFPEVRSILLEFMQNFANNPPAGKAGVVLDGRDIGTTVCPHADYKFFLTSAVEVRANRRHKELLSLGIKSIYSEVLSDMIARDKRDSEREDSPLRPAADAHIIDTSEKSIDEVLTTTIHIIDSGGARVKLGK